MPTAASSARHSARLNDQATIEEIRKINPAYATAISRDVADRGNALAEKIDAADGNGTASAVAKVLLMSSLSTAESPLRGLTCRSACNVDPLSRGIGVQI
jgi:hypothetical protein